jgi:hypothetical protein
LLLQEERSAAVAATWAFGPLEINNDVINCFNNGCIFCVCFFGLFDLFLFGHLM